ncbi:hypothetical protein PR048_012664, partial [Dryococelus australis]
MCLIQVMGHRNEMPFHSGICVTNNSVRNLFSYLKEKYGITYLLTDKLSQDVLENIFSYIRSMGCANDLPTLIDFKYRMRWYILGKYSTTVYTRNCNTTDNNEGECPSKITSHAIKARGGLGEPSEQLLKTIQLAEQFMENFSKEINLINLLTKAVINKLNCIRQEVIYHFIKPHTYIRIKIVSKQHAIRRKILKNILKFEQII